MVNQVQVIAALLLVVIVAGGVKLGNDVSLKCPVAANPWPVALDRVEVKGSAANWRRRAHDNGR